MSRMPQHVPAQARKGVDTGLVRHALRQSSRPLQPHEAAPLERSFGFDLAHLRVHSNPASLHLAEALDARAVTVGPHILLGADSERGGRVDRALLAHEVAHALQQPRQAALSGALSVSRPGQASEQHADRAALAVQAGETAQAGPATGVQAAPKRRGLTGWVIDSIADADEVADSFIDHPLDSVVGGVSNAAGATVEGFKEDARDLADLGHGAVNLGSGALDNMRQSAEVVRKGGEGVEQWLQDQQAEASRKGFEDAEAAKDRWYGPALSAMAWTSDKTGEFSTGVAKGAVSMGTGLLSASADPVDTVIGLGNVVGEASKVANPLALLADGAGKMAGGAIADKPVSANEAFNPFAEGKPLRQMGEGLATPYMKSIDEGRYLDATGRFAFDLTSLLVGGGEANSATKPARMLPEAIPRAAPKIGISPLATTLTDLEAAVADTMRAPHISPKATTLSDVPALATTELAPGGISPKATTLTDATAMPDTLPGPGFADTTPGMSPRDTLPAPPSLADTQMRPYPTLITPGGPGLHPDIVGRQLDKALDWLGDQERSAGSRWRPLAEPMPAPTTPLGTADTLPGAALQPTVPGSPSLAKTEMRPYPTLVTPDGPGKMNPWVRQRQADLAHDWLGDNMRNLEAQPSAPTRPTARTETPAGPPRRRDPMAQRQEFDRPPAEMLPPRAPRHPVQQMTAVDPAQVTPGMAQPDWFKAGPVGSFGTSAETIEQAIAQAKKLLGMK